MKNTRCRSRYGRMNGETKEKEGKKEGPGGEGRRRDNPEFIVNNLDLHSPSKQRAGGRRKSICPISERPHCSLLSSPLSFVQYSLLAFPCMGGQPFARCSQGPNFIANCEKQITYLLQYHPEIFCFFRFFYRCLRSREMC